MNKKNGIIIACVTISVIVVAFVVFYVFLNRPASTMVYVESQTISGTVGQNFTININIMNVADLYGWQLKLSWNATILDVANVTEGTFLKSQRATFFNSIINETGYLVLDCALLGDVSGVDGSGVMATIQFHVRENGSCDLLLYDTVLVNSSEQIIAHTVRDGRFST